MTGIAGTQVEYGGKFNSTSSYNTQTAVLDADGVSIANMSHLDPGNYTIEFIRIKKPGSSSWKYIDLNQASTSWNRGKLVLDVLAEDPDGNRASSDIGETIRRGYLGADLNYGIGGRNSVSYGVVESPTSGIPPQQAAPQPTPQATCLITNNSGKATFKAGETMSWSWVSSNATEVGQTNSTSPGAPIAYWGSASGTGSQVLMEALIPTGQNLIVITYSFWAKSQTGVDVSCGTPISVTVIR